MARSRRLQVISWALYDWANSAFATTVMAAFFPVFFKQYWNVGVIASESTMKLGTVNSVASAVLALLAPILGAIADQGSAKKRFLFVFTAFGVLATAGLFGVARGDWVQAALLFVIASIGFAGANSFYDSLLVSASGGRQMDWVSGLGFSLGYLGGGLLFAVNIVMVLKPHWFGLTGMDEAVRWSFISVAVWWSLFSLPLFWNVAEPQTESDLSRTQMIRHSFRQLKNVFSEVQKIRPAFIFLMAYFFYIDGVSTIMRMAVDYGMALGFKPTSLMLALLLTQLVGFPAALVFGWAGERWGAKRGIYVAVGVYAAVTIWSFFMGAEIEFYGMAVVIGLVQGGVQSLSRSLFARMIPAEKSGEYFGFYNMLGKFSAIMGPALVAITSYFTRDPRTSILSVLLLFALGGWILQYVQEPPHVRPTD